MAISESRFGTHVNICAILFVLIWTTGCSRNVAPKPDHIPNAKSCYINILKSKNENLSLWVLNVDGSPVCIQRHSEDAGGVLLEVQDTFGRWGQPAVVDPNSDFDARDLLDTDWVLLRSGESLSWHLIPQLYGRLNVGDKVRLKWKTIGKLPSYLAKEYQAFTEVPVQVDLVVRADTEDAHSK